MRHKLLAVAIAGAVSAACTNAVGLSTGLSGTVLRGPVTPVCQVNQPCDAPFAASFEVRRGGQTVATFTSNADGRYTVRLRPGSYVIVPGPDAPIMSPELQTKNVEVGADGITLVDLTFDTGIR